MRRAGLVIAGAVLAGGAALLNLANASWLATPEGRISILAHRGVHQTFPHDGVDDATCTARRIRPPTHSYLENTLPSIRRAFALGADVVEIDIHPTRDGDFVVFHDWTLDCRTDGAGVTREKTLAELKTLDVGWGYTADGGRTFPFRGSGRGAMPSLAEVLTAFPGRRFMVNIKSNDVAEADLLVSYLRVHDPHGLSRLTVMGGERPVARLKSVTPELRAFSTADAKACAKRYLAMGWTGRVPDPCRGSMVFVPQKHAWLLWGWPNRFLARMQGVDTEVYIAGDLKTEGRLSLHGLDDPARLKRLPKDWRGGVSTDRIELIGPALADRR